ncbi:MAG: helix-turn-helix domain-containing protein [Nanoarchaeota archaeon]|nr:helix-turn-helix domain-containing protein [Nanoarchaeota archaeon]
MDTSSLEKIGLTRNESLIYISLLKLGFANAQQILKESELHRSRVYDSLESLERKGLVSSVIKDYKRYFQAVKPEKLLDYINEQKENIKSIISDLKNIEGSKREDISASIFKGKEGLKSIYSQMLKEGKDVHIIGAKGFIFSELKYFMPNFERERLKKKMKWICLWDTKEAEISRKKDKLVEGHTLPPEYKSNGVVKIFGNKVALVSWNNKNPQAFMLNNKEIADAFRKWFDLLSRNVKNNSYHFSISL